MGPSGWSGDDPGPTIRRLIDERLQLAVEKLT
jgi:hypothetical protein